MKTTGETKSAHEATSVTAAGAAGTSGGGGAAAPASAAVAAGGAGTTGGGAAAPASAAVAAGAAGTSGGGAAAAASATATAGDETTAVQVFQLTDVAKARHINERHQNFLDPISHAPRMYSEKNSLLFAPSQVMSWLDNLPLIDLQQLAEIPPTLFYFVLPSHMTEVAQTTLNQLIMRSSDITKIFILEHEIIIYFNRSTPIIRIAPEELRAGPLGIDGLPSNSSLRGPIVSAEFLLLYLIQKLDPKDRTHYLQQLKCSESYLLTLGRVHHLLFNPGSQQGRLAFVHTRCMAMNLCRHGSWAQHKKIVENVQLSTSVGSYLDENGWQRNSNYVHKLVFSGNEFCALTRYVTQLLSLLHKLGTPLELDVQDCPIEIMALIQDQDRVNDHLTLTGRDRWNDYDPTFAMELETLYCRLVHEVIPHALLGQHEKSLSDIVDIKRKWEAQWPEDLPCPDEISLALNSCLSDVLTLYLQALLKCHLRVPGMPTILIGKFCGLPNESLARQTWVTPGPTVQTPTLLAEKVCCTIFSDNATNTNNDCGHTASAQCTG